MAVYTGFTVFLSLKIVSIFVNSSDPDEMQHYAAFYLGLHCLPKYPFSGKIRGKENLPAERAISIFE